MEHMVTWAEIAVTDMERAMAFYQTVLQTKFRREQMGEVDYAMFDTEQDLVSGALVASDDHLPSKQGTTVYLNGGADLSVPLARVTKLGNPVIVPKTAIGDGECGFFAQFIDSEGNRVGLYSTK